MIGVTIGCNRGKATGNRNRDIADRLFISEETVKAHMKHIVEKLGASDRTQACHDRGPERSKLPSPVLYLTVAPLMNARMSALITSAFVVIMPCEKPG